MLWRYSLQRRRNKSDKQTSQRLSSKLLMICWILKQRFLPRQMSLKNRRKRKKIYLYMRKLPTLRFLFHSINSSLIISSLKQIHWTPADLTSLEWLQEVINWVRRFLAILLTLSYRLSWMNQSKRQENQDDLQWTQYRLMINKVLLELQGNLCPLLLLSLVKCLIQPAITLLIFQVLLLPTVGPRLRI